MHMGLSTSDTERFFSLVRRVIWPQRSLMSPDAEECAIRIAIAGMENQEPTRAQLDAVLRVWQAHCGESRTNRVYKPRVGNGQECSTSSPHVYKLKAHDQSLRNIHVELSIVATQ